MFSQEAVNKWIEWQSDWNRFVHEYLGVTLDQEQREALYVIQHHPKVAIASGTSRGKDYLTAVAAVCFMYLTPEWDENGRMISNTKVILSAPTGRQVKKIMMPEVSRVFRNSQYLPGVLTGDSIRTPFEEWYLHAFKADDTNIESWTGFHAVNIFFGITEATGLPQQVFDAIEGNLQGNSRLLIVFNPNINHGYAADAMKSPHFKKIRLNSLNAPNVVEKRIIFPGQVDYGWVMQRVEEWCERIRDEEKSEAEGDFHWEGSWYRPNDLFRAKILGLFPKVSEGVLVPLEWIEAAQATWRRHREGRLTLTPKPLRLGVDVAGMGRDSSAFCLRFGPFVSGFEKMHGSGKAVHMEVAGKVKHLLEKHTDVFKGLYSQAFIDTIGEGAGVYSRLEEQQMKAHSCKFSEGAVDGAGNPLTDHTGQYQFTNMRGYSYWAIRDWLNPDNNTEACLPDDPELVQELMETKWKFMSNGKIQIEAKEEIKKRLKRSPDKADALANTFWNIPDVDPRPKKAQNVARFFH